MYVTRDFGGLISAFIWGIFFAIIWLIAWAIVGSITKPIMILGWVFIENVRETPQFIGVRDST